MSIEKARLKLRRAANAYYNRGLEKARVRDLSGAAACLRASLRCDKNQIDARNLLGLIYFEQGELTQALTEWVISQDLKKEDNLASEYLRRLQRNQHWLDRMNGCIRKYNQALDIARRGDIDLAAIQLNSLLGTYKNHVRSLQLLALLYIQKGEPARAVRILKRALDIDRSDAVSLRYLQELKETAQYRKNLRAIKRELKKDEEKEQDGSEAESYRRDVIIPTYRETGMVWKMGLVFLAGLILGILISVYGIAPEMVRDVKQENADLIVSYSSKMALKDAEIAELNKQAEDLAAQKASLEAEIAAYTGEGGVLGDYEALLAAANAYLTGNTEQAAAAMLRLDKSRVSTDAFRGTVASLESLLRLNDYAEMFRIGTEKWQAGDAQGARPYLTRALEISPQSVEALYYLGRAEEALGDKEAAAGHYKRIVDEFPGFALIEEVRQRLEQLTAG